MAGHKEEIYHWFTTPDELRSIADKMEEAYKNFRPGTSNSVREIVLSEQAGLISVLNIHFDQEAISILR